MLSHALEPLSNAFALLRDSLRANAGDSEGCAYGTCALNSGGCSPGTVQRDMRKRRCRQTKLIWLWIWSLRYCVGQMAKWCLKAVSHFFSSEYSNVSAISDMRQDVLMTVWADNSMRMISSAVRYGMPRRTLKACENRDTLRLQSSAARCTPKRPLAFTISANTPS